MSLQTERHVALIVTLSNKDRHGKFQISISIIIIIITLSTCQVYIAEGEVLIGDT